MGLFDALGSALGVAGSSLVGPAFSAASGLVGNLFADNRQESANEFSAQNFATRYQTTVKDMQAAGLNPMLAYSQGGGNAPSSAIASANMPDVGATFVQSKIASAQEANLAANTRKTNAEALVSEQYGLQQAEANLASTLANTGLTSAQIAKVRADTDNSIAQLSNIKLEGDRLIRAAELLYQQANESFAKTLSESQRYDLLKSQARLYLAQAGLANADLKAVEKFDNFGNEYRQYKPIVDLLKSIVRPSGGITINK